MPAHVLLLLLRRSFNRLACLLFSCHSGNPQACGVHMWTCMCGANHNHPAALPAQLTGGTGETARATGCGDVVWGSTTAAQFTPSQWTTLRTTMAATRRIRMSNLADSIRLLWPLVGRPRQDQSETGKTGEPG